MKIKFSQKAIHVFLVAVFLTGLALTVVPAELARAATITVDGTTCTLVDAITAANTDTSVGGCMAGTVGLDTIDLQIDVTLSEDLPTITSEIIIDGNNHILDGDSTFQILDILFLQPTPPLPPIFDGNLTLQELTVTNGFSSGGGGGIAVIGGSLTVISSTISSNSADYGGGIYNNGGTVFISNSIISENSAAGTGGLGDGGGIYNGAGGSLVVMDVSLISNQAADAGGAVFDASDSVLENVSFIGNQGINGAGYFNQSNTSADLTNAEFLGNLASGNGAGIMNRGVLTVTNTTLSGNLALGSGGAVHNSSSEALFQNTIVWNNEDISGTQIARASIFNTGGAPTIRYSDFEGCNGSSAWEVYCGLDGGNNIDADPVFVIPVDLSSLPTTIGDLRLSSNSASANKADDAVCPSYGLGGNPRPLGPGCDQGTYEYFGAGFIKTVDTPEVAPGQTLTYTIHIFNATTASLTGGVVSDTLPAELNFVGPITLIPDTAGDTGNETSLPDLVTNLSLNAGEEVTVTLPVSVSYGVNGVIENTAWLTFAEILDVYSDTVGISVTNVAPVAVDDAGVEFQTFKDSSITTGNVLDNDYDENGDMLTIISVDTGVLSGTLTSNGDGTFKYDPNGQFDYLTVGQEVYDIFTYEISDGALTDTASVTVTVRGLLILYFPLIFVP